jgi:hypothetical protein
MLIIGRSIPTPSEGNARRMLHAGALLTTSHRARGMPADGAARHRQAMKAHPHGFSPWMGYAMPAVPTRAASEKSGDNGSDEDDETILVANTEAMSERFWEDQLTLVDAMSSGTSSRRVKELCMG